MTKPTSPSLSQRWAVEKFPDPIIFFWFFPTSIESNNAKPSQPFSDLSTFQSIFQIIFANNDKSVWAIGTKGVPAKSEKKNLRKLHLRQKCIRKKVLVIKIHLYCHDKGNFLISKVCAECIRVPLTYVPGFSRERIVISLRCFRMVARGSSAWGFGRETFPLNKILQQQTKFGGKTTSLWFGRTHFFILGFCYFQLDGLARECIPVLWCYFAGFFSSKINHFVVKCCLTYMVLKWVDEQMGNGTWFELRWRQRPIFCWGHGSSGL